MEQPLADSSRRRATGRAGKPRGGKQLGLKRNSLLGTSAPPPVPAPPQPPVQAPPANPAPPPPPDGTSSVPPPPKGTPSAPNPTPAAPISSPPAPASTVPPQPSQGAGWGAIPPNFTPFHGNQQASNSWGYPPGGFVNFMQQPHYPGQNFHLVGQTMSFNPISQSPPNAYGTATPEAAKQGTSTNEPVTIDTDDVDKNEDNRSGKKRFWTPEEEERLANCWLNASKDPIKGNDKNGATFWKEVTDEFNKKGNGKPCREINQLKIHWSRLKTSITDFNGFWTKVCQVHTSGYSDDMLEEEAQKMYANKFGKRFSLVHWWKILKGEPKWCAQFDGADKNKSETIDLQDDQPRPIGREAAKAERSGKRKREDIMEGIVILGKNIEKIITGHEDRRVEREKVTDAQIHISNTNLKAAKEQKEAKMFEVYNSLLKQDISQMSEDQKANRQRAIFKLEEKLFAD